MTRIVLLVTSPRLPAGLLSAQAWDLVRRTPVFAGADSAQAAALRSAGVDVTVTGQPVAEDDLPLAGLEQTDQAACQRRLAAAGLPYHPQRLALLHGERHVIDRMHVLGRSIHEQALLDREVQLEVLDGQEPPGPVRARARQAVTLPSVTSPI